MKWCVIVRQICLACILTGMLSGCALVSQRYYPPSADYDFSHTVTVRPGDSYSVIAKRFNLDVDELIRVNRARPPFIIHPGEKLLLPQPNRHKVRPNESLRGIANYYDVDAERMARLNGLRRSGRVKSGMVLKIPVSPRKTALPIPKGGTAPFFGRARWDVASGNKGAAPKPRAKSRYVKKANYTPRGKPRTPSYSSGGGSLRWPVKGRILSGYGPKGAGEVNDGINILAAAGTPVQAAGSGEVIYRGNAVPGFGKLILVRHDNNIVTAYAHLESYAVSEGERVRAGQMVGRVGKTGSVTEPQLHFEVRRGVRAVDPMPFLGSVT